MLVDIDIGMARCGVPHTDHPTIVRLSQLAASLPGLKFRGLMGYDGHTQCGTAEARAEATAVAQRLAMAKAAVEAAGLEVGVVSGAGSGNYVQHAALGGVNEVQAGGGSLFCQTYELYAAAATADGGPPPTAHRRSLLLLTQVVSVASQSSSRRAVGDAGFKATFPTNGGLPRCLSHPAIQVTALNAEHCHFDVSEASDLALGERLVLLPFYSDSTVCLHLSICGVRQAADGQWAVETTFDLAPSLGALQ